MNPHYLLTQTGPDRWKNGSRITDMLCPSCRRVWRDCRLADLEEPAHGSAVCDDCADLIAVCYRIAQKAVAESRSGYWDERGNEGIAALCADLRREALNPGHLKGWRKARFAHLAPPLPEALKPQP